MSFYFAKTFNAQKTGRKTEFVTCEKCRAEFCYELVRTGTGRASAPYYLFQGYAERRAEAAAEKELNSRLQSEAELVPCPRCNWVNEELITRYRGRQYRRAPALIAAVMAMLVLSSPLAAVLLRDVLGEKSPTPSVAMIGTVGLALVSPIIILLIRRNLRLRIDPNSTYPRRPVLPPGTPPALLEKPDPESGRSVLQPAPASPIQDMARADWAVYRAGEVAFPPFCCLCIEATSMRYLPPFTIDKDSELSIPMCDECRSRVLRQWWLWALFIGTGAWLIAGAASMAVPGIDQIGRAIMLVIGGLFLSVVLLAVLPTMLCRPYRYKKVDADRGIVKFQADNPRYTELMVQRCLEANGLAND